MPVSVRSEIISSVLAEQSCSLNMSQPYLGQTPMPARHAETWPRSPGSGQNAGGTGPQKIDHLILCCKIYFVVAWHSSSARPGPRSQSAVSTGWARTGNNPVASHFTENTICEQWLCQCTFGMSRAAVVCAVVAAFLPSPGASPPASTGAPFSGLYHTVWVDSRVKLPGTPSLGLSVSL